MKITDLLNSDNNNKIDEALPALAIPAAIAGARALAPAIARGASSVGNVIKGAFGKKPGAAPSTSPAAPAGQQSSNVTPIRPGGPTTPQTAGGGRPPAANEPAAGAGSQPSFVPQGQQAQPVSLSGKPTAPGAGTQASGTVQQRTIPAPQTPAPQTPAPQTPAPAPSTAAQVQKAASGAVGATAAAAGVGAFDEPAKPEQPADTRGASLGPEPGKAQADAAAPGAGDYGQAATDMQGTPMSPSADAGKDELSRIKTLSGTGGQSDTGAGDYGQAATDMQGTPMSPDAAPGGLPAAKPATQPEPAAAQAAAPTGAKPTTPPTDIKPIAAPVPPPSQATVKSGTTLSQIAKDNNTTVADMMKANPELKNPDAIRAGMKLNIPTGGTSTNPYAGGVGTAADTAKKVASGEFASYQDALKAIPRGDVDKPVAPGSVQTRAGTWKAGEKGTIDAPVLSRGATTTQGSTGTTPPASPSARADAEARSSAMRDQQALGGQGGDTPVTAPRAQSDKDLADIRKLAGTDDARTTEVPPIDRPLSTPPGAEPESSRRRAETGLQTPPLATSVPTRPQPGANMVSPETQAAAAAAGLGIKQTVPSDTQSSSTLPPEAGQTTTTTRSLSNRSDSSQPYQPGLDAAKRNADRMAARLQAQRDSSPEWQNAPSTTTTNPDGTVTTTRSASWTVPPNPNAGKPAKDNAPPEIARRDFEESLERLRQLIGHRS